MSLFKGVGGGCGRFCFFIVMQYAQYERYESIENLFREFECLSFFEKS